MYAKAPEKDEQMYYVLQYNLTAAPETLCKIIDN